MKYKYIKNVILFLMLASFNGYHTYKGSINNPSPPLVTLKN